MGNPAHSFRETNLVLHLMLESQIKSMELVNEKRGHFFVQFILSEGNVFNISVLSQCVCSVLNTIPECATFTYQKILVHTLFIACF